MLASIDDFIRVIAGARDCIRRRYDIAQNERDLSEELARKKQHSSMSDVGELEMKIEEERQRLNGMASVIDEEVRPIPALVLYSQPPPPLSSSCIVCDVLLCTDGMVLKCQTHRN